MMRITFASEITYNLPSNPESFCSSVFKATTVTELGIGAKCYGRDTTIIVDMGKKGTLVEGSEIEFQRDAIKSKSCNMYMSSSFIINAPSQLPLVRFRVDVPKVVPICPDSSFTIRITDIGGLARRDPNSIYVTCLEIIPPGSAGDSSSGVLPSGTPPPTPTDPTALNNLLNSTSPELVSGGITYEIPTSLLAAEHIYKLNIVISNFNNDLASQEITIKGSKNSQPNIVNIQGLPLQPNGMAEVFAWQNLNIQGNIWPTGCGVDTSKPYLTDVPRYSWGVKDLGRNLMLTLNSSTGQNLKVEAGVLKAGGRYKVTLIGSYAGQPSTQHGVGEVIVEVQRSKLQAHIKGSDQDVPTNFGFALDARKSFDPDNRGGNSLTYLWRCIEVSPNAGNPCIQKDESSLDKYLRSQSRVYIPKDIFVHGIRMKFSVIIRENPLPRTGHIRTATTNIEVLTVKSEELQVRIEQKGRARKYSVNEDINLVARVRGANSLPLNESTVAALKYKWSSNMGDRNGGYVEGPLGKYFRIPGGLLNNEEIYFMNTLEVVVEVLMPNNIATTATKKIELNLPPIPGDLSVLPTTGIALVTSFTFLATDWHDEDLPLSYTIYSSTQKPLNSTFINIWKVVAQKSSSCASGGLVVFPQGLSINSHVVYIKLRVGDIFGAITDIVKEITVIPFPKIGVEGKSLFKVVKDLMEAVPDTSVDTALQVYYIYIYIYIANDYCWLFIN